MGLGGLGELGGCLGGLGGCLGGLGGRLSRSGWARRMPRRSRH